MPSKTSRRLASVARELKDSVTTNWRVEGPYQWGTVGIIHGGGSFSTVDVYLDSNSGSVGATLALGIPFINGYNPTVGDVVLIGRMAGAARTQRVVLGPLEIAGQGLDTSGFYQGIKARFGKNTDTTQEVLLGEAGTGEGIGSKRTAGGNQFGIDFYTNGVVRGRFVSARGGIDVSYDNSGSFAPSSAAGGGGTVPVKIAEYPGNGTSGDQTFSSIPQGFRHLMLEWQGRSDLAGNPFEQIAFQFDGDQGNNYQYLRTAITGTNTTLYDPHNATSSISDIFLYASTATAAHTGMGRLWIPLYAGTTWVKGVRCDWNFDDSNIDIVNGFWNNTAAITSIRFVLSSGGKYLTGTVFTLYGIP
jgi:hypothetical protein